MRDMIPEREINPFQLPEHDDYDYDLYFFVPSRFPYIVSPEDLATLDQLEVSFEFWADCLEDDRLTVRNSQGPSFTRWALLNEQATRRSVSPAS